MKTVFERPRTQITSKKHLLRLFSRLLSSAAISARSELKIYHMIPGERANELSVSSEDYRKPLFLRGPPLSLILP